MSPFARIRTVSRLRRIGLVGALAVSLAATGLATASIASAAAPTFPDNLVVFPDRDFVMVEGYQTHVGETATIEITRPGVGVVGSAQAVVAAGDVAFEINHPGGACWGAGTALKVTPDILPGDVASISFGGTKDPGVTTVQDGFVTGDSVLSTTDVTGDTVTVTGHIAAGVNQGQTEQRIIDDALNDTVVDRRDVRAIPGPMEVQDNGYRSGLAFTGTTFTATYVFDDPAVATIVANAGGARLMSWEVEDADANRQGLTIAEFGELGGPGMGGCPNGPLQTGPPGPTNVMATTVGAGVTLTWTPAVAPAGTPPITGYRVTAVAQTTGPDGEQVEIGQRVTGQAATGVTITGLSSTETYHVEVVAVSSVGQSFPPVIAIPVADIVPPTVSATPAGGTFAVPQKVTLSANESGSQIFFTTDGTDPVQADVLNPLATHYTEPFTLSTNTTVKFVAFDATGNLSLIGQEIFILTPPTVPGAPVIGTATAGNASATVKWTAPANAATSAITGYSVQAFAGTLLVSTQAVEDDVTSVVVAGLTNGTEVRFQVQALSPAGTGAFSALSNPVTPAVPPAPAPSAPTRVSDFNGDGHTDLVARDTVGKMWLYPGTGAGGFKPRKLIGTGWHIYSAIVSPGDVTGDGDADILARDAAGRLFLYEGKGSSGVVNRRVIGAKWNVMTAITGAGDMTGDSRNDILARDKFGNLWLYPMTGNGAFQPRRLIGTGWNVMTAITGPGDFSGDSEADILARDNAGKLWLYRGTGLGAVRPRTQVATNWGAMSALVTPGNWDKAVGNDLIARDGAGTLWNYPGNGTGGFNSTRRQLGTGWNGYMIG